MDRENVVTSAAPTGQAVADRAYSRTLGLRLRSVRQQRGLSLHGVEARSQGRWKAVVVGSYERGDRAVTAQRLYELAAFYGVPVTELLPRAAPEPAVTPSRITLDLARLASLHGPEVVALARFVGAIQRRRCNHDATVLTVRAGDLDTLGLLYDETAAAVKDRLLRWQVLCTPLLAEPPLPDELAAP